MTGIEEKVRVIEEEFEFFLDAPIMESAKDFPSPEDFIEDWYLTATVFRNVRVSEKVGEALHEVLMTLIEEAEAEYSASKMLGEEPDTQEVLGIGYDGCDISDDFAANYQAAIWREVIAVHGKDTRPQALTRVSK